MMIEHILYLVAIVIIGSGLFAAMFIAADNWLHRDRGQK